MEEFQPFQHPTTCIDYFVSPPPTTVTNDTVKVEVWDVVDKGKVQRKDSKGVLKLFNNPAETQVRESSSCLYIHLLPGWIA